MTTCARFQPGEEVSYTGFCVGGIEGERHIQWGAAVLMVTGETLRFIIQLLNSHARKSVIIITSEILVVESTPVERYGGSWLDYLQAWRLQVLHIVGCGKVRETTLFILSKTILIGNVTSHPDCHSRMFGVPFICVSMESLVILLFPSMKMAWRT